MEENQTEREAGTEAKKKRVAKSAAREIAYTAMFVAIITVCAWLAVALPTGISITLQTMGVCMAAGFLGWKRGLIATAVYILLGLCGVPVFQNFTAGIAKLGSATGGYIVGFLFTALIVGLVADYVKIKNVWLGAVVLGAAMAVGILVCYAFGTAWFIHLWNAGADEKITLAGALGMCVVPYLVPDLIKIVAATALVTRLKKYMKLGG